MHFKDFFGENFSGIKKTNMERNFLCEIISKGRDDYGIEVVFNFLVVKLK